MSIIEILTMAVALGTDAFSVAVVIGVKQYNFLSILRISGIIGLFHIIMPVVGLYGGSFIKYLIHHFSLYNGNVERLFDLIGAGLLLLIGLYMIIENWLDDQEICNFKAEGWGLFLLASSVSIDALSVGVSLGMLDFQVFNIFVFGIVAALMMSAGLLIGSRIGNWLGDGAQIWGGLTLIYLGFHFMGLI